MITCKRCGICCKIPGILKDCKHLIRLKSGKTLCRVYNSRLGKKIGKMEHDGKVIDVVCMMRECVKQNYSGCPFNKEEYDERSN